MCDFQVDFGLYPVVVKEFASTAEPLVLALYQDVGCFPLLFLCALIAERKLMFPRPKMLLVHAAAVFSVRPHKQNGLFPLLII